MKEPIHTIKLIEDDEIRGPGRRPRPIQYIITEEGCWRIVNRALSGLPGYEYSSICLHGHPVAASRFFYVMAGHKLEPGERLQTTCGHSWCVNPEHHVKGEVYDVLNR